MILVGLGNTPGDAEIAPDHPAGDGRSGDQITAATRSFVALRSVVTVDQALLLRALGIYEIDLIDLAGAYLVACAESSGVNRIASFARPPLRERHDAYNVGMRHVVETLRVEPLDATFGAVVRDVILRRASDATIAELTELWLEYALLVFPGQYLTQQEQDEFARRFGDLEFAATPLTNIQRDGTLRATEHDLSKSLRANERWHHDSTYMPVQAKGAVFTAEIVPDEGGDTGFADMRAAYDALDDATRERVGGLAAHHSRRYSMDRADLHVNEEDADRYQLYGYGTDTEPPLRPLVKVHPATRRPNLLIGQHAHAIVGLTADESETLLDRLNDDACTAPRIYFHTWTKGEAVLWDNRRLMHRATPHDPAQARRM